MDAFIASSISHKKIFSKTSHGILRTGFMRTLDTASCCSLIAMLSAVSWFRRCRIRESRRLKERRYSLPLKMTSSTSANSWSIRGLLE
ncbi:uncharacterized protein BT62DRAFT_435005 [Guyanagaster necrorhizus]|uniref:Uncharacterized protein n=1 Tax=Guyanagaster necrorhizus TaxID=856835 RepID=A0A9P7W3P3_9AGAR|nr:uncharacterized protein BT62DRAFT_435005 [Guyanagaster necrorhizus MCA 3950]KAG7451587.1 hypothetical protein BT62DRAFT_435005 [Guyanagaster necrorhizus MCA 3950]